jgi:hypothetical protein
MQLGRVALEHRGRFVSVGPDGDVTLARKDPGTSESFQWIETPNGDLVLMSLATNRFLRIEPASRRIVADNAGPLPDGSDGVRFGWALARRAIQALSPLPPPPHSAFSPLRSSMTTVVETTASGPAGDASLGSTTSRSARFFIM